MTALPIDPTERDRERFKAAASPMIWDLFERDPTTGDYTDPDTDILFRLWWSVERERQLLQNLNQSQGRKLSEMGARAEKAEEVLRSLASFVGAGGYNADKVDADVFEQKIRWGIGQIMERLEKAESELEAERRRLDWALEKAATFYEWQGKHYLSYDVPENDGFDVLETDNPRATIDELIAGGVK